MKPLSHRLHLNGRSEGSLCVRRWRTSAYCCLKLIWHSSQWKGRSSECVRSCCRRSDGRLKPLPQLGVTLPEEPGRKVFSQMEHFMGLVLLWAVWCWAREVSREKPILHTPHTNGFCSTCTHWCSSKSVAWWKIFMHWVHWNDRSWFTMHWCSCGLARWEMSCPQAPHLCPPSAPTWRAVGWAWAGCCWACCTPPCCGVPLCCWPCWLCCKDVASGCSTMPYTAQPSALSAPGGRVWTTAGGATACCCQASDMRARV
ncbi:hypothetical protein EYF80_034794 [Liparis tanakae]|uniref:Uncharacterized protein n=1 Tax=Liparis tanakae TaxID=230148 RepID=A0A4Z2GN69_9TELE|nr:hypothetical protein EYF80_034794 [Liparis tanakae]